MGYAIRRAGNRRADDAMMEIRWHHDANYDALLLDVTGMSAQNERGDNAFQIDLLKNNSVLAQLRMDIETAKMLKQVLGPMKVLDESTGAVPAVSAVSQDTRLDA
jgi:hypothetical protein